MKTAWHKLAKQYIDYYNTMKCWNNERVLRKCRDKGKLCIHAGVWNTCADRRCEKEDKMMTNREWLNSLTDLKFVQWVENHWSDFKYMEEIIRWLSEIHDETIKIKRSEMVDLFESKFAERRAISMDELLNGIDDLFNKYR